MVIKGNKEIGAYIGMSQATFIRRRDAWGVPYFRAGKLILARTEDLDEWMENRIAFERGETR